MRDYEEKSYYEIQLDNKQLILVFLAAVTVCVLIFVLGVMIGKGQKEAEIAAATRTEKNALAPESDSNTPQQPLSDIASKATKENNTSKAVPAEKQEPIQKTAETGPPPEPKQEAKQETKQQNFAYEDLDKKDVDQEQATTVAPETSAEVPPTEGVPKAHGGPQYTVQIMATSSKPKAEQQLSILKSKGYKAFLDETKTGNVSVFKVRVGRFGDTQEAKELASRIKKDLRLETWVAALD
jgi:septal ring-binding cell division protein DamX